MNKKEYSQDVVGYSGRIYIPVVPKKTRFFSILSLLCWAAYQFFRLFVGSSREKEEEPFLHDPINDM